jgi:hypothetical protein
MDQVLMPPTRSERADERVLLTGRCLGGGKAVLGAEYLDGLSAANQRIPGPHVYGVTTLDDVVTVVEGEKCQNTVRR